MTELEQFARDLYAAAPRAAGGRPAGTPTRTPTCPPCGPAPSVGLWPRPSRVSPTTHRRRPSPSSSGTWRRGSQLLRDVIATGLLEALASAVSGGAAGRPDRWPGCSGPQSRAYLDAWDQLTLGRSSLEPS